MRHALAEYPWERPLGAREVGDGQTEFRVWAPRAHSISLLLGQDEREVELRDAGYGVYETVVPTPAGTDYRFLVDGTRRPDPCSRWQPAGLRGPSRVLGRSPGLRGRSGALSPHELVIYELHVGAFTDEGTFEAAAAHLRELAQLGITAIEIMPVAEFPGVHGWGYDGVYISAAHSAYGGPAGLAALVEAAHQAGLGVILDVVYNHVGASGAAALDAFGPYFTDSYQTPWGRAINFDDADCDPVREWVLQSATEWIADFGIDGLRLDAIHAIFDSSAEHIVAALARRVHEVDPHALVIAESGLNDPRVVRPVHPSEEFERPVQGGRARGGAADGRSGGYGCDAAWADDFHHALRALLTGEREGYYAEFGAVSQLAKAWHRPHVHDGGYSSFRRRRFGAPAGDVAPERFVVFSQDHDQVGNRAYGDRMPASARPLAAFCVLLAPFVPLLFMGEEYGEPAPFQFFSDHIDEQIADATREGRRREFAAFAKFDEEIPDPQAPETFARSKLTRRRDPELARLYGELLAARRRLPRGDADEIELDERAGWLRVRRGGFELACNFAADARRVPCEGAAVALSTHGTPRVEDGHVALAPLSGALIQ
ncbi:MAG: alpha-amylase family glycosyl hydrolase [Solirubrobacteraceae bacterium]